MIFNVEYADDRTINREKSKKIDLNSLEDLLKFQEQENEDLIIRYNDGDVYIQVYNHYVE